MAKYRLLVFDLDGTLVDSLNDLAAAVNYVRAGYALPPLEPAAVRSMVGSGVTALLQRALPGMPEGGIAAAKERFNAFYPLHLLDTTKLYPGVKELIGKLQGKTKAVLTNKPEEYSRKILAGLGIGGCFSLVWGGDTGAKRKPDPDPLLQVMDKLGFRRQETLMIGDGANDVLAARAAGVRCAAVAGGYTPLAELAGLKPEYLCGCLEELIDIAG